MNFTRNWGDYENGFGDLDGEFWLGLKNVYELTNQQRMSINISVWNDTDVSINWKYHIFGISGPETNYQLTGHVGMIRDGNYGPFGNEWPFSTYDNDNDISTHLNCAYSDQGVGGTTIAAVLI